MTIIQTPEIHRVEYKAPHLAMPDWGAAGWAGLISGTVYMLAELILLPLNKGGDAWVPVRFVAAIIYGHGILPPPPYFIRGGAAPDSTAFFLALALHFSLALIYTRVLSLMIYKVDRRTALGAGAFFGLILYALNFYGFTAAFPWFASARGWATVLSNILFGLCAAATYKAFEKREPLVEDEDEVLAHRMALRRH